MSPTFAVSAAFCAAWLFAPMFSPRPGPGLDMRRAARAAAWGPMAAAVLAAAFAHLPAVVSLASPA